MNLENKIILQRVDETGTAPNIMYTVQNITLDANNQPQKIPCPIKSNYEKYFKHSISIYRIIH